MRLSSFWHRFKPSRTVSKHFREKLISDRDSESHEETFGWTDLHVLINPEALHDRRRLGHISYSCVQGIVSWDICVPQEREPAVGRTGRKLSYPELEKDMR